MKPGEQIPLSELLDPKQPSRAQMVELVPPPAMKEVDAPQMENHAPGMQGFPGRTLEGSTYMIAVPASARLPRWVRITISVFAATNALLFLYWLILQIAPTR